jgi:hypothetical protein
MPPMTICQKFFHLANLFCIFNHSNSNQGTMKRIFILLQIAVLTCSCNKARIDDNTSVQDNDKVATAVRDSTAQGVALRLQPRQFTIAQLKDKASLIMENNSKEVIMTGDNYHVERLNEGKWEMLEVFSELAFNSIGYMLRTGESKEFEISFLADKQRYTPGKYRIVKHYVKDADIAPKASYNLYSEFEVSP